MAELDKAPAFPARESPPQPAPQVAGRPPAPQAQAALCLAWGWGAGPGPRSFLASAKPSLLSAHCAHCLRCSTPAVLTWSRLPGLPQLRSSERRGHEWCGGPFHHDSPGEQTPSPTLNMAMASTQSQSGSAPALQPLRYCLRSSTSVELVLILPPSQPLRLSPTSSKCSINLLLGCMASNRWRN